MHIQALRCLRQIKIGIHQHPGDLYVAFLEILAQHLLIHIEHALQLIHRHDRAQVLPCIIIEKHRGGICPHNLFQPFAVLIGIVILGKAALKGADIKHTFLFVYAKPSERLSQIIRDQELIIRKQILLPAGHGLEDQHPAVIQHKTDILLAVPVPGFDHFQKRPCLHLAQPAKDGDPHNGFCIPKLIRHAAQPARIGIFLRRQQAHKPFLSVYPPLQFLVLFFIFEHGFDGHFGDQSHRADLLRVPGDPHHPLPPAINVDHHIDPGAHTGIVVFSRSHHHVFRARNNIIRHLMKGAHPFGVPAGDDHAFFIHDIDVVIRILRYLLYELLGQVKFYH